VWRATSCRSKAVERPHAVEISDERKPSQRRREQRKQVGKPERATAVGKEQSTSARREAERRERDIRPE